MDIETQAAKLRKRIEKLTWDLTTNSQTKRDQKDDEIKG